MQRMVDLVQQYSITVRLAYYPPYHSKYNAIERCWGILENHWNGALLDSIDAVIQVARTMTWNGKSPIVDLVTTPYETGVKLTKKAMQVVEAQIQRLPELGKWFVDIVPAASSLRATLFFESPLLRGALNLKPFPAGPLYGLGVYVLNLVGAGPALDFTTGPWQEQSTTIARRLISHIIYGIVTALVTNRISQP
jgi:hypothetical protein